MIRKLTQNLRKYGSIEPNGFYGRPFHGTGDNVAYMSKANFLRVAAYLREDSPKNLHYINSTEAISLGLKVKPDARPLYLESWQKGHDGEYNAELLTYYNADSYIGNVAEITNISGTPDHHTKEDFEKLADFIGRENLSLSGWQADRAQKYEHSLFSDITSSAEKLGQDKLSAKMFAHLCMKTFNYTPDYSIIPLYTEEEVTRIEEDPQKLLTAISRATNLMKEYPQLREAFNTLQKEGTEKVTEVSTSSSETVKIEQTDEVQPQPEPVQIEQVDEGNMVISDWIMKKYYTYTEPYVEFDYKLTFNELYTGLKEGTPINELLGVEQGKHPNFYEVICSHLASLNHFDDCTEIFNIIQHNNKDNLIVNDSDSGLFKGLEVHVDFTDSPLKDGSNNYYLSDITLKDDRAYEFLVKFTEMDKRFFNDQFTRRISDGKSRISFKFNDFVYNEGESFRVDLGYFEFGNKMSVADALENRLTLQLRQIVKNDDMAYQFINMDYKDDSSRPSVEEYQQEAREQIEKIKKYLQPFREAEKEYIKLHPAVNDINTYDGKPYVYICKPENFTGNAARFSLDIIPGDSLKDYCVMPCGKDFTKGVEALAEFPKEEQKTIPLHALESHSKLPESMMAFISSCHPEDMNNSRNETTQCLTAIPAEDIENLQKLNGLKLEITSKLHDSEDKHIYKGISALSEINTLKKNDERLFDEAVYDGIFIPLSNFEYTYRLTYNDKELSAGNARMGEGSLASTNFLPTNDEELFSALNTAMKHTHDIFLASDAITPAPLHLEKFPTVEKSLQTWKELGKEPEIPRRGGYDYYKECYHSFIEGYASIDPANNTVEKRCNAAIKRMIDTGRNLKQIENIAKNCYQFNTDISDTMLKLVKSPAIKKYAKEKTTTNTNIR